MLKHAPGKMNFLNHQPEMVRFMLGKSKMRVGQKAPTVGLEPTTIKLRA